MWFSRISKRLFASKEGLGSIELVNETNCFSIKDFRFSVKGILKNTDRNSFHMEAC
jgi:hypothetical protein